MVVRTLSSPHGRYAPILQALHWATAILVLSQYAFILCVSHLLSFEFANILLACHRNAGLLILLLVPTRIVVGFWVQPPSPPAGLKPWQIWSARIVHWTLPALLMAQSATGIAMSGARGDTIVFLGLLPLPEFVAYDPELSDRLLVAHAVIATLVFGLIALHVGAVAFHAFVRKRNIMPRMLPRFDQSVVVNRIPIWAQIACGSVCLLAITIGVGVYAESQAREATALNKALYGELFGVGDAIKGLEEGYSSLVSSTEPEARLKSLSSMKTHVDDIKQKTINLELRDIAIRLSAGIAALQAAAQPAAGAPQVGKLIDEL